MAGHHGASLLRHGEAGDARRLHRRARSQGRASAADTWTSPPVLQNTSAKPGVVELTLTASPTRLELVPGKPTEAWAYNGTVPGPTIELREGDLVTVHFHNKLAQQSTMHWHGLHLPASSRRQPAASRAAWQEPRLRLPHSSWLRGHVLVPPASRHDDDRAGVEGPVRRADHSAGEGSAGGHHRPAAGSVGQPLPGGRRGRSAPPHHGGGQHRRPERARGRRAVRQRTDDAGAVDQARRVAAPAHHQRRGGTRLPVCDPGSEARARRQRWRPVRKATRSGRAPRREFGACRSAGARRRAGQPHHAEDASVRSLRHSDAAERLGPAARCRRAADVHGRAGAGVHDPGIAACRSRHRARSWWPRAARSCSPRE